MPSAGIVRHKCRIGRGFLALQKGFEVLGALVQAACGAALGPPIAAPRAARSVFAGPSGDIGASSPNFLASAILLSGWATYRSSPVSPISPNAAIGWRPSPSETP